MDEESSNLLSSEKTERGSVPGADGSRADKSDRVSKPPLDPETIQRTVFEVLHKEFPPPAGREAAVLTAQEATPDPAHPGSSERRAIPSRTPSEPIPARMLNEFVYCQRLFYYEFVFAES